MSKKGRHQHAGPHYGTTSTTAQTHLTELVLFQSPPLELCSFFPSLSVDPSRLELIQIDLPLSQEPHDLQRISHGLVPLEFVLDVGIAEGAHLVGEEVTVGAQ